MRVDRVALASQKVTRTELVVSHWAYRVGQGERALTLLAPFLLLK